MSDSYLFTNVHLSIHVRRARAVRGLTSARGLKEPTAKKKKWLYRWVDV